MRVAAVVLTCGREHLRARAVASLHRGEHPIGPVYLVDNAVLRLSIGAAKNHGLRMALDSGADLILSSDDDYEYRQGWLRKAVDFFTHAPADVGLLCALLEKDYPWNQPRGVVEAGGMRALVRDTVPGGGWLFRREMADLILPLPDKTGGEDVEVCKRLVAAGYRLCAADLAEHIGERESLIGNFAWRVARPLDRARWGV